MNKYDIIYIINIDNDPNTYKIGYTNENGLKSRISSIQTGNPCTVNLIKSFTCIKGRILERKIHNHLKDYNIRGEWFNLQEYKIDKLINYIEQFIQDNLEEYSKFCCHYCNYTTNRYFNLETHINNKHKKLLEDKRIKDKKIENIKIENEKNKEYEKINKQVKKEHNKVQYTCKKCNKMFKLLGDYKRHINKKFPCKLESSINNLIESVNDSTQCKYCNKILSSNSNYHRHVRNCKLKEICEKDNQLKEGLFENLMNQMDLIFIQNKEIQDKYEKKLEKIQKQNDKLQNEITLILYNKINMVKPK